MCEIVNKPLMGFSAPAPGELLDDGTVVVPPLVNETQVQLAKRLRPSHNLFCHHGDEDWELLDIGDGYAVCPAGTHLKAVPKDLKVVVNHALSV